MMFFRRRIIYGCGNCRETFRTEAEMKGHQPCPLYRIEKEVAEWNRQVRQELWPDGSAIEVGSPREPTDTEKVV